MNEIEEDITYFSAAGEYLEDLFKLSDFLSEPTTRVILENNHNQLFEEHIEPNIKKIYELKKTEISENTRMLHRDNRGLFLTDLLKIIYNNVNKKYDLEIFYNNPELARHLVAKYKTNIKNNY
tara:strand:+ start:407 stop:775 length:369 start_codon:yes stop_codon:yes gene_type:complete